MMDADTSAGLEQAARVTGTPEGGKRGWFLLGKGYRVNDARCTLCGVELESPLMRGEKFEVAEARVEPGHRRVCHTHRTHIRLGARELVTGVNLHLLPMLDRMDKFLGEKVLVGMPPRRGKSLRHPRVFCVPCGLSLYAKINRDGEDRYCWDWLAEMQPRGLIGRWRNTLRRLTRHKPGESRWTLQWPTWRPATLNRQSTPGVLRASPAARAANRSG